MERRSSDEEAVVGVEAEERFVKERVVVLESVRLVHAKHRPRRAAQVRLVLQKDLVSRDNDVELEALVARVTPLVLADLKQNVTCHSNWSNTTADNYQTLQQV